MLAVLFQIPNEPLVFAADPTHMQRSEDDITAFAWRMFMANTSDWEWIPHMPMTKAAIKTMDAVTEFWQESTQSTIVQWVVSGASKRGWTAWLVGTVDPRCKAVVPIVLDELNFAKNVRRHYEAYSGWSFAISSYLDQNITTMIDLPEFALLMTVEDPLSYTNFLTMPKYIVSAAGDELQLPDNVDYYFPYLQGESHFHSLPNFEHSLVTNPYYVARALTCFSGLVLFDIPRPIYNWNVTDNGTITLLIDSANPPINVTLWVSYTIDKNTRRDFRLIALYNTSTTPPYNPKPKLHPVFWLDAGLVKPTLVDNNYLSYSAYVPPPSSGWVGFSLQMAWNISSPAGNLTFTASTAPSILPNTYPSQWCSECTTPIV
jgi:PhoPQ-activated pathogenicity-related protein